MKNKKTPTTKNTSLRRHYNGAVVGGVLKGIAIQLNIDVTILRILYIVLTLFSGGIFIVLYILMYLLIPAEKSTLETTVSLKRMLQLAIIIVIGISALVYILSSI